MLTIKVFYILPGLPHGERKEKGQDADRSDGLLDEHESKEGPWPESPLGHGRLQQVQGLA